MTEELHTYYCKDCFKKQEQIDRLEQERDELKFENDRYKQLLKGCPTEDEDCGLCVIDEQNKKLKQENKSLQAYKDINEDFKQAWYELNEKYKQLRSALEEIREYCNRIERGEVIGTQDCLINSIKNIVNYTINEN